MTMVLPRLAAGLSMLLVLAAGVTSAAADPSTAPPTGLHGFLLRVDEPQHDSFNRTPAFAWNPVPGAARYEFELSTSNAFRDNGIIWQSTKLQSPVVAPALTLPWITGSPHALYARVRAVISGGVTEWSNPFGFDLVPPPPPTPLTSAPGLLRWTPVEGANGYQVWLIDANKTEAVFTNVLDERDFYTFHQSSPWIGTVRWRIRAFRDDYSVKDRQNGMPVTQYGAWSPIYVSTNPDPTSGPIHLGSTISDVVADGGPASSAHRLMPAFTWTGNQTDQGAQAELFRVYVFTDKQCLNRVLAGGVVGSPAYAPRPYGGLSLPVGSTVDAARSQYLPDGNEPKGVRFDGEQVESSESADQATPTVSLPLVQADNPAQDAQDTGAPDATPAAQSSPFVNWTSDSKFGAPVDLWDTDWPRGGYYWTVIPVGAVSPGALQTNVAPPGGISSATSIPVANSAGFAPGDTISVGNAGNLETGLTVTSADGNALGLATPLTKNHGAGEPVVRTGGSLRYVDLELPQDVCAAGRVARFGINSEPSVIAGGDVFASGLSPSGKLTSAVHTAAFYRAPLVSWTQALGASVYQVQWSKTESPFNPEPDPATKAQGILTGSTSYVLPLTPGTWYYRVRGYDYSLPTGAQQMGWSDVAQIVVTPPTFTVVSAEKVTAKAKSAKKKARSTTRTYSASAFSITLPASWRKDATARGALFDAQGPKVNGVPSAVEVSWEAGRGTRSWTQWAQDLKGSPGYGGTSAITNLPAGQAVLVRTPTVGDNGVLTFTYAYFFPVGNRSLRLEFGGRRAREKADAKVFAAVVRTFKIH
jgi:hypothetical protein